MLSKIITEKREELEAVIKQSQADLRALQETCKHPAPFVTKKAGANTGNYCSGDDSYWYDWDCECCGKRWRTDQ